MQQTPGSLRYTLVLCFYLLVFSFITGMLVEKLLGQNY